MTDGRLGPLQNIEHVYVTDNADRTIASDNPTSDTWHDIDTVNAAIAIPSVGIWKVTYEINIIHRSSSLSARGNFVTMDSSTGDSSLGQEATCRDFSTGLSTSDSDSVHFSKSFLYTAVAATTLYLKAKALDATNYNIFRTRGVDDGMVILAERIAA